MDPDLEDVLAYLKAYALKVTRERKFPLWTREDVESECWLLWHHEILMKHQNNLHQSALARHIPAEPGQKDQAYQGSWPDVPHRR